MAVILNPRIFSGFNIPNRLKLMEKQAILCYFSGGVHNYSTIPKSSDVGSHKWHSQSQMEFQFMNNVLNPVYKRLPTTQDNLQIQNIFPSQYLTMTLGALDSKPNNCACKLVIGITPHRYWAMSFQGNLQTLLAVSEALNRYNLYTSGAPRSLAWWQALWRYVLRPGNSSLVRVQFFQSIVGIYKSRRKGWQRR